VYEHEVSVVADCELCIKRVWKTYLLFGCVTYVCCAVFIVQKQYILSGLCQLLKTQWHRHAEKERDILSDPAT